MKSIILFLLLGATARASDQGDFRLRFAFSNPETALPVVALQAENGTAAVMTRVCGPTGGKCTCEFQDFAGHVIERHAADYEAEGNYFNCAISAQGVPARVRLYHGSITSPALAVRATLTTLDLLGKDLDVNRMRSIYRYTCDSDFLQKEGTSRYGFSCTPAAESCDGAASTFCLLRAKLPYYLYADTFSNNYAAKIADRFYGADNGICGVQLRSLNCVGEENPLTQQFGLYGSQTDTWQRPVSLSSGPDQFPSLVGFAASPSKRTGACPPGLVKRALFSARMSTADIRPSSNIPDTIEATELAAPELVPAPLALSKIGGGSCNGMQCVRPSILEGRFHAEPFVADTANEFCVIPVGILPAQNPI